MRLAALALVLASTAARADGFYYSQAYGVSSARGAGATPLGESLHLRIAMGWRFGAFTVGPLIGTEMAVQRDHAYFGFVGGDPTTGDSDLKIYGVDTRYHATLYKNLVMYVRAGPRYASALGTLDGYRGFGIGAGTGVQLSGQVRALGFVFAPLFFSNRGPKITASLFLDQNVDWYQLQADRMPMLSLPLVATSIGIAAGSHF
jgi:hypothetical protein